ncbi:MAG TPA: helix-hairpin-helix domain-containing protein [Bacteroidia bacterium]|nr:helix-hairpin-helix domain-containing protein [Bacteroidia bacterium]
MTRKGLIFTDKKSVCIIVFSVISVLFFSFHSLAQVPEQKDSTQNGNDDLLKEKIETVAETSEENADMATLLDQLNYFSEHPVNLNSATFSELQELTFLNDIQINALLEHIKQNGKLIVYEELQTIDGFDAEIIQRILPYVVISDYASRPKVTLKKILSEGKSNLFLRYQQVMEKQQGYNRPDSVPFTDNKWYPGSPAKYYVRYRYTLPNRLRAGFTAEKDAGETFFDSDTLKQGFDFYSAHLFYYGKNLVRTVVVGDYQVQYGQGLVLWSGLAFGKTSDVANVQKNARGILPYTSVDENVFMRGGAVSLGLKNFSTDIFYSDKKIDGSVSAVDTLGQEFVILSITETGNHRTFKEIQGRHTIGQKMFGGHVRYSGSKLNIGITGYRTELTTPLLRISKPYNLFQFSGIEISNYGINYSYLWKNISFFGETGRSDNGGMATVNGALLALDKNVSAAIVNRHYEKNYIALLSNALGENTLNANENGTYFSVLVKPVRTFALSAYFDRFNFPWLRYLVNAPSRGYDIFSQATYTPSKVFEIYFRYRERSKPENESGDANPVDELREVVKKNYRVNIRYKYSFDLSLSSRMEWVNYHKDRNTTEYGFMMSQEVKLKFSRRISTSAEYILFDTDTYNARIYSYENDVLYSYSIPFYYYRGSRYVLNMHYKLSRNIDFWIRYSHTRYSNRNSSGSGLDEIDGNTRSDLKAQVRFSF